MRNRIRINDRSIADKYANASRERIAEVFDPVTQKGCLISVWREDDGRLRIDIYRADPGVYVNAKSIQRRHVHV